jgi:filamentous hemagglutinin family protein
MFASKKKMPSHWLNCINSRKIFKSLLIIATVLIGVHYDSKIQAQITPDESLREESSVVTPDVEVKGKTADRIDGGVIRDRNLFHSFSQFNVGESQSVYFANPDNIDQIFTRVTGDDPSNILGTLGVDGAADLLLLNPNGIIFGENSSLDVEGSFFGTTADSVVFEDDTEFSAVNPQSPLLTVDVPLGLQVGSNPGSIIVRSPLVLPNGQNLSLIGGKLEFAGTGTNKVNGVNTPEDIITVPGGRVELGGLSTEGIIEIEENGNLSFPEAITRADVTFNNLTIDVSAGGGGSIMVNARNLELFDSDLEAGIDPTVELASDQAGDIIINATDQVSLTSSNDGVSTISNVTGDISELTELTEAEIINTQGNAGNIQIQTESLEARDAFSIGSFTNGAGNAGNVSITASESINLLPTAEITSENGGGGIYSYVGTEGTGNGANIGINTPVLALSKSFLFTTTIGSGDAGDITINATDNVSIRQASQLTADTFSSGNSGNLTIAAPQADILMDGENTFVTTEILPSEETNSSNSAGLDVDMEQGGNIMIQGRNVSATNGAVVSTRTAREENAGDLTIDTNQFIVKNSIIVTSSNGSGQAGNLNVTADESIDISGTISGTITNNENVSAAGLFTSNLNENANAAAGNLTVNTQNLTITEGATIEAATLSSGDGGNITIEADEILLNSSLGENSPSFINALTIGSGDAGTINISTNKLVILDNAGIAVASEGDGNAGKIFAQVRDSLEIDTNLGGISSFSDRSSGGEISISAGSIRLKGNSSISSRVVSGTGGGGNLTLSADTIVALDKSDLFASSSDGVGGNITLDTDAFFSNNFNPAFLNADPEFLDNNNRVDISASGAFDGVVDIPDVNFLPNSLIELSEEILNTDEVVSNSCVLPNQEQGGTFVVTGTGGLAVRPNDAAVSNYGTGDVRTLPQKPNVTSTENEWQPGEPIVEPEGIYRLSNGQLVLSRECN